MDNAPPESIPWTTTGSLLTRQAALKAMALPVAWPINAAKGASLSVLGAPGSVPEACQAATSAHGSLCKAGPSRAV
jgi:hypothetical protein